MTPSFADLPIGFGRTKKFAYTTSITDSIDFVMNVNSFKGPNSGARNGNMISEVSKLQDFPTVAQGKR